MKKWISNQHSVENRQLFCLNMIGLTILKIRAADTEFRHHDTLKMGKCLVLINANNVG